MPDDDRFEIAPATWRDFREFLALERACFPHDTWPWFDILAALTFPHTVRLKAVPPPPSLEPIEVDGGDAPRAVKDDSGIAPETNSQRAIGFVIGDRRRSEKLGWVASIGVHPEYQRRGVGRRLLAACELALGTPRIRLTLRPSNVGARRLYEEAGYIEIGTLQRYYLDGEDGLMMEKVI
ncbi:MAG TPA: GNAT family N-acetyltransferase, partial [Anaerolineales bacterium]|nr:GNAT family N-acetyltransferase [Anaerolineales bacterium]